MMNKRDQHQILAIRYIFRTEIREQVQDGGNGDHKQQYKDLSSGSNVQEGADMEVFRQKNS